MSFRNWLVGASMACASVFSSGCSGLANLDYVGTYIGSGSTTTAINGSLSQRSFSSITLVDNPVELGLIWQSDGCDVPFTEASSYGLVPTTCTADGGSVEYRSGQLVFDCDYDPLLDDCVNSVTLNANYTVRLTSGESFEGTVQFSGKE